MNLYKRIIKNIIDDYRQWQKDEDNDCYTFEIVNLSREKVSIFEDFDVSRDYTINNPKFMDRNFLKSRLYVTKTAKKCPLAIDEDKVVDWLFKYLPKHIYLTLEHIIIIYDEDEDFNEVSEKINSELLEEHDFPDGRTLGITWLTANSVVVSLKAIEEQTKEMVKDGLLYDDEERDCYNYGFVTTLIHELRHLAQQNPYLPEDVLQQEDEDEEEDAEMFARNFCDNHPLIALI